MPLPFRPTCQPTSLGPLPHTQPAKAWEAVLHSTPQLPALRLLPSEQVLFRRSMALFGLSLGPISMALSLVDEQLVPVLNDAELLDACAKHVYLRRLWTRTMLERMGKPAILWVYEPYMAAAASPFCPLPQVALLEALEQSLGTGT